MALLAECQVTWPARLGAELVVAPERLLVKLHTSRTSIVSRVGASLHQMCHVSKSLDAALSLDLQHSPGSNNA